jgi:hypothetical protein
MINPKDVSIKINKELVRVANPEFFSDTMMRFIGHTDEDWSVGEHKGQPCVFVNRPAAGAIACYFVNPLTYKLAFWCHIADTLTA